MHAIRFTRIGGLNDQKAKGKLTIDLLLFKNRSSFLVKSNYLQELQRTLF